MPYEDITLPVERSSAPGCEHCLSLPALTTPLFGREHELAQLCAMLRRTEVRLLTLNGPGGVGKTRLALAVASAVQSDFTDGVCFVSLAQVSDPAKVVPAIAQELGLWETRDRPLMEQVQTFLESQHRLLLLDNFEQVIDAAAQLSFLLSYCPHLYVLVTSRATLRLSGEYEFPVAPLAVPNLTQHPEQQTFGQVPSVRLFLERARAIKHGFALTQTNGRAVAEICVSLDGLPLAIELAAARIKLLSPQALLKRLSHRLDLLTDGARDLPVRQQTLRNTLQWSYDLLSREEQRLFRWLSVFVGGCTLEAVKSVCLAQTQMTGVLDKVTSLIDKSLVQQSEQEGDEPRIMMLETMREYGLERRTACGEWEEACRAHAAFYVQRAEESEPRFAGSERKGWLNWWERELGNVRAALQRATTGGSEEVHLALRLSSALKEFWFGRGHLNEGRGFLEQLLANDEGIDPCLRLKALEADGRLAWFQSDHQRVEQVADEYVRLAQKLGELLSEADVLFAKGLVALGKSKYTQASLFFEEALALAKEGKKTPLQGFLLMNLGRLALSAGDESKAVQFLEESVRIHQAEGHMAHTIISLYYLARAHYRQGEFARARTLLEANLALCREVDYCWVMARVLCTLGQLLIQQRELETAESLLKESLQLYRIMGDQRGVAKALLHTANLATAQGAYSKASACYEESLGIALELKKEGLIAAALKGLGVVTPSTADERPPLAFPARKSSAFPAGLTAREVEVLRLVAQGLTDNQVAMQLVISYRTITTHLTSIYNKLGVNSRTAAVRFAAEHQLI
ncbi:MAG: tetratricopeptide repeat protein [Chloroflexi bacterium]|nr:tetratricopeptide repeat protein [Chloroflexota bacterium]